MQMIAFIVICVATMFSLMTWILSTIAIKTTPENHAGLPRG